MRLVALAVAALLGLLLSHPAQAQPRPVALIIDSSGSMAAEMDGEARLDIAREMIVQQAAEWAAGEQLALVAYGHRREGDCTDIETLLPLGPVDVDQLSSELDQLRARGKTPLSASLIEASKLLPDGGAIILVSDGLETCGADPCSIATGLHEANVDVEIHVIGFGVTEPELAALACIATNGGGRLVPADSGQALALALERVNEIVRNPVVAPEMAEILAQAETTPEAVEPVVVEPEAEPPPPVPAEPPPPTPVPVAFEAMTPAGRLPAPVGWTVTPVGEAAPIYEGGGIGIALDLVPGRYAFSLAGNNVTGGTELEVSGPTELPMPVPIVAGHLLAHLMAGDGLTLAEAELGGEIAWTITPLDGQGAVAPVTGLDPSAVLAPGRYAVSATLGGREAKAEATIVEGQTTEIGLSLALGRLTLELVLDAEAGPVESGEGLLWSVTPLAGGEAVELAAVARPTLVLPAGDYAVTVTLDGATVGAEAAVVDGEARTVTLSNAAGTVTLEGALGPGAAALDDWRNAVWTVTPAGSQAVEPALTDHAEARPVLQLVPGEWDVTLKSGSVTTTQRFTVEPGVEQTIRVEHAAGLLRLTGRLTEASEPLSDWRDIKWTVRSADGATTLMADLPEVAPVLVVPAGDWMVTLVSGGASIELPVTVAAGTEQSIDAVLQAGRVLVQLPEGVAATVSISALDETGNPVLPAAVTGSAAPDLPTVLAAGQYVAEATTADGRYASAPFELAAGDSQTITLSFD